MKPVFLHLRCQTGTAPPPGAFRDGPAPFRHVPRSAATDGPLAGSAVLQDAPAAAVTAEAITAETVTAEGEARYYHGNAILQDDGTRNGVFSEWSWDGTTLVVRNCRYGMSHLFYYCGDGEFCLSNSIPKLLERGVPGDWDDDAMAVFIRRHTFLGEDTPFRHIRALPPGAELTWTNGRMTLQSRPFLPKPQHLKREAIVEGVIDLFAQSIARRLPGTEAFYLPLTGGKDSRHILLELARQSALPKACVTAAVPRSIASQDVEIAAQIAARLALPHVVLPAAGPGIADEKRKNLMTSFCTLDHGWALPLTDFLQANTPVSYDGLGLDVFFNTIWFSDKRAQLYAAGDFENLAVDFIGDSEPALAMILKPEMYRRFSREKALARIVEELKRHADKPHPIASFQFWNRTRRSTSTFTFAMQAAVSTVHTPYLDTELFDFVSSCQPDIESKIHDDVFAKAYPSFHDMPFVTSGIPKHSDSWNIRNKSFNLLTDLLSDTKKTSAINAPFVATKFIKGSITGRHADFDWLQPVLIHHMKQMEDCVSP
jgi:hypothetical protein